MAEVQRGRMRKTGYDCVEHDQHEYREVSWSIATVFRAAEAALGKVQ